MLASKLQINASDVHGFMIGEHGERCFPVRSSITLAGVPILRALSHDSRERDLRHFQAKVRVHSKGPGQQKLPSAAPAAVKSRH